MAKLLLEKLACRARHHLRVLAFLFQEILLYLISSRLLLYLRLRARYKHEHFVSGGPILGILVQAATDDALQRRAVEKLRDFLLGFVEDHFFKNLSTSQRRTLASVGALASRRISLHHKRR